jgi:hypothetical protein
VIASNLTITDNQAIGGRPSVAPNLLGEQVQR